MYHGGRSANGTATYDDLKDIRILPGGEALCLGQTSDLNPTAKALLIKLSADGKAVRKKSYGMPEKLEGTSVLIAANGDFLFGGDRFGAPILVRLDSAFNIKWSTWYYDSIDNRHILSRGAAINAILETPEGHLVAAAGEFFPDNYGLTLHNYAAFLEFDAAGVMKRTNEWSALSPTGSAGARHTAGVSGANDIVYDVAQLLGGNLVFVGKKRDFDQIGGVWAFVTDSSGSQVLWEKQLLLPYLSDDGVAADPNAVPASPIRVSGEQGGVCCFQAGGDWDRLQLVCRRLRGAKPSGSGREGIGPDPDLCRCGRNGFAFRSASPSRGPSCLAIEAGRGPAIRKSRFLILEGPAILLAWGERK